MSNDRARFLVEDFEKTVVEFIRRHGVTHDEYRVATDFVISEVQAGEASLAFDVLFEAEATDNANRGREGSIEAIEGPFYLPGAPMLEGPRFVMPQRPDERGIPLVFHGRITTAEGEPLAGVELDMWHADADGKYSQIHPGIPDWNLRGRFTSEADGTFEVTTIAPPPYEIPKDGPTGQLLSALGRHCFRPAHLHLKLRHPYFGERTSQLYFEEGEYLESDVANAVRDGLVLKPVLVEAPDRIKAHGLTESFVDARYDFVMSPARAASGV
ncbi:dioxygenase [Streptomyces sp. NPDC048277]|uniref:dioxygenase family protein n=1 Tax=Streptomyces sp. NPDC048277 TaxID=3155027 RepID=UPI0033FFEFFE